MAPPARHGSVQFSPECDQHRRPMPRMLHISLSPGIPMAAQTGRFRSFLDGLVEPQPADETLRTSLSRIPVVPDATDIVPVRPAAKIPLRRQIDNYIALTKPGIL